jgi:VanZ family protein
MIPRPSTPRLRAFALVLLVVYWTVMTIATHWPLPPRLLRLQISDKLVHLAMYFVLAALACVNVALWRRLGWRQAAMLLAAVAAWAVLDELTQPMFGRYGDVPDWVADLIGATMAVGLLTVVAPLLVRPRQPAADDA